jgi:hypothetical protein
MGSLFDGGTKQVQQQATQTALPQSEVQRLSGITGQQQAAIQQQNRRRPIKTVLGTPIQPVGNSSPSTFGLSNG